MLFLLFAEESLLYVTGTDRDNFSLSTIWDTSGRVISSTDNTAKLLSYWVSELVNLQYSLIIWLYIAPNFSISAAVVHGNATPGCIPNG